MWGLQVRVVEMLTHAELKTQVDMGLVVGLEVCAWGPGCGQQGK